MPVALHRNMNDPPFKECLRHTPLLIFALVLVSTFGVEGTIMLALPHLPTWAQSPVVSGLLDATLLALLMAPAVWWLVVTPLRCFSAARGELLRALFDAQEQERARIAADLHDEIGQQLTAILVGVRLVESAPDLSTARARASDLRNAAATAHEEVRRLARGLLPGVLTEFGLCEAIEHLCDEFQRTHDITVALDAQPKTCNGLPRAVKTVLYRIVQESLTNVARHADATAVSVTFKRAAAAISISVEDDGRGFPQYADGGKPFGRSALPLHSIRERAQVLHGECEIGTSAPGGALVHVKIPLAE